jgi:hypothetical protein
MIRKIVLVVLCLLIIPITIKSQSNYAVVRGSILDPEHHAVASARIHITARGTGVEREVASNASGLYDRR